MRSSLSCISLRCHYCLCTLTPLCQAVGADWQRAPPSIDVFIPLLALSRRWKNNLFCESRKALANGGVCVGIQHSALWPHSWTRCASVIRIILAFVQDFWNVLLDLWPFAYFILILCSRIHNLRVTFSLFASIKVNLKSKQPYVHVPYWEWFIGACYSKEQHALIL